MPRPPKKREFQAGDLAKSFAKIYGFEDKLLAFEVKDYLKNYLDEALFSEIISVNLEGRNLIIKIASPLLKNDFQMRRSFYLKKFNEVFGEGKFTNLLIL